MFQQLRREVRSNWNPVLAVKLMLEDDIANHCTFWSLVDDLFTRAVINLIKKNVTRTHMLYIFEAATYFGICASAIVPSEIFVFLRRQKYVQ